MEQKPDQPAPHTHSDKLDTDRSTNGIPDAAGDAEPKGQPSDRHATETAGNTLE